MLSWQPAPGRPRSRVAARGRLSYRVGEYHSGLYIASARIDGVQGAIYMPNAFERIEGDACRAAAMAWCERHATRMLAADQGWRI